MIGGHAARDHSAHLWLAARRRQDRCYGETRDLELVVDKEIVALGRYEERDLGSLDLEEVSCDWLAARW